LVKCAPYFSNKIRLPFVPVFGKKLQFRQGHYISCHTLFIIVMTMMFVSELWCIDWIALNQKLLVMENTNASCVALNSESS